VGVRAPIATLFVPFNAAIDQHRSYA